MVAVAKRKKSKGKVAGWVLQVKTALNLAWPGHACGLCLRAARSNAA